MLTREPELACSFPDTGEKPEAIQKICKMPCIMLNLRRRPGVTCLLYEPAIAISLPDQPRGTENLPHQSPTPSL